MSHWYLKPKDTPHAALCVVVKKACFYLPADSAPSHLQNTEDGQFITSLSISDKCTTCINTGHMTTSLQILLSLMINTQHRE